MKLHEIWREPSTTVLAIGAYLLFVAIGAWTGYRDLWDPRADAAGRLVQISTKDRRVAIRGRILRLSFREHRTQAFLHGDGTLDVRVEDLPHAALLLTIECGSVLPGDRIVFQRRAATDRVVLTDLEEWRRRVTIPLLAPHTRWLVLPTTGELRYRVVGCEVVARRADELAPKFESVRRRTWEHGPFRISAGSGWWWPQEAIGDGPLPAINYQTEHRAYLIVETAQPGRHWLKAPFAAVNPDYYKLPALLVDGERTDYHHGPMGQFGGLSAEVGLGPRTVIGFASEKQPRSPYEFGENADHRPISYAFQLAELKLEPPQ